MATDDFFRSRLDQMIDLRHPLAVLAQRMPWSQIEAALAPALVHKNRAGTSAAWSNVRSSDQSDRAEELHEQTRQLA